MVHLQQTRHTVQEILHQSLHHKVMMVVKELEVQDLEVVVAVALLLSVEMPQAQVLVMVALVDQQKLQVQQL